MLYCMFLIVKLCALNVAVASSYSTVINLYSVFWLDDSREFMPQ